MSKLAFIALSAAALAVASQAASAAVLSDYFNTTAAVATSADADANSTSSTFAASTLLAGNSAAVATGNPVSAYYQIGANLTTLGSPPADGPAAAVAAGSYVGFTITPVAGQALNLTSLTFSTSPTWGASTTASWRVATLSSVGGFGSAANALNVTGQDTGVSGLAYLSVNIDLTGTAYQNLTSPVEFRMYLSDSASGATSYQRIDNVVLNGTTTAVGIPEPTSLALLGLGGLAMIRRRR
jgi:hypothetical protein